MKKGTVKKMENVFNLLQGVQMQVELDKYGMPDWVLYVWAALAEKNYSGTLLIDFRNGKALENYRLRLAEYAARYRDRSKRKEREDAYNSRV